MVLRQGMSSIQVVLQKSEPNIPKSAISFVARYTNDIQKPNIYFIFSIAKESVVDIEGTLQSTSSPIEATSQKNFEIQANRYKPSSS